MDINRLKELKNNREAELDHLIKLREKSPNGYIGYIPAQHLIDECSGKVAELNYLIREEEINKNNKQIEEHFNRVNEYQVRCEHAKKIELATIIGKCSNFYLIENDLYCTLTLGKIGDTKISLHEEWDVNRVKSYAEYKRICIQGGISEKLNEILEWRNLIRITGQARYTNIEPNSAIMDKLNEVLDLQVRLNEIDKEVEDLEYKLIERNKK